MFENKTKGDTVYFIPTSYTNGTPKTLIITKKTSEFIYTHEIGISYPKKQKFNIQNGYEVVNIGASGKILPDIEYYQCSLRKKELDNELAVLLKHKKITINQLEYIKKYLECCINSEIEIIP